MARRARRPNVYAAVAGRVKRRNQRLRPDEVLFKKKKAPTRFAESDYYPAHKNLAGDQKLPDSGLLKSLHAYVAKLYLRTRERGEKTTWKCMDETAFIALGVLMEEAAKNELGETGHFALVEGPRRDEEDAFATAEDDTPPPPPPDIPPRQVRHDYGEPGFFTKFTNSEMSATDSESIDSW